MGRVCRGPLQPGLPRALDERPNTLASIKQLAHGVAGGRLFNNSMQHRVRRRYQADRNDEIRLFFRRDRFYRSELHHSAVLGNEWGDCKCTGYGSALQRIIRFLANEKLLWYQQSKRAEM